MKRSAIIFFVLLVSLLAFVGCNNDLKTKFPEYYDLSTFKGIEVYVWQDDLGNYRCGAMTGTNRNKTPEEIIALTKNGATIDQMKDILSSYDVAMDEIIIIPVKIGQTDFEIITDDLARINEVFWQK